MSIAVLIANGGNSVKVPCMFWSDIETARKETNAIFGDSGEDNAWNVDCGPRDGEEETLVVIPKVVSKLYKAKKYNEANEYVKKHSVEFKTIPVKRLFTSYYDECGGVVGFSLRVVEEGKPFVGFDLD